MMTAKREHVLLMLGILISLVRLMGGYWLSSHALLGWGLWALCELWLRPGINRSIWGLGFLFIITAAVFGVVGGAVKEAFKLLAGFPPVPPDNLFVPILVFASLLLWEGGVSRHFKFDRGQRPSKWIEGVVLLGGLTTFFLVIAGGFLQGYWLLGDAAVGIILGVIMLIRLIPSLMAWTMDFFPLNNDPQNE